MSGIWPIKILIVFALLGSPALAQTNKSVKKGESKASKVLGNQLTTILNFGWAGGALGLSTLSFYGRPQDKLNHIPVGMALGIIVGTIVSTSQAVTEPLQQNTSYTEPIPSPSYELPLAFQWRFEF